MKRFALCLAFVVLSGLCYAQSPIEGFAYIRGGTFTMGSPTSGWEISLLSDERKEVQHTVMLLDSFYMAKYEVTQKEWVELMGSNPSRFRGANLPVENVSWYDAVEYCNRKSQREGLNPAYTIDRDQSDPSNGNGYDEVRWLVTWDQNANGYRLPTEAEWEYACRGGVSTLFSMGNTITTTQANYNGEYAYIDNVKGIYRERTWDVGSGAANPFGLFDMHGNVWEWCWDWYETSYTTGMSLTVDPTGTGDPPFRLSRVNPTGAGSGAYRVLRGGSWYSIAQDLRSAARYRSAPSYRNSDFGFRLVRSGVL
jgi:formylglycine-generating enzyme required for sulfatase activity